MLELGGPSALALGGFTEKGDAPKVGERLVFENRRALETAGRLEVALGSGRETEVWLDLRLRR